MQAFPPFVQVATYATRHFATFGLAPAATQSVPSPIRDCTPNLTPGQHVGHQSDEPTQPDQPIRSNQPSVSQPLSSHGCPTPRGFKTRSIQTFGSPLSITNSMMNRCGQTRWPSLSADADLDLQRIVSAKGSESNDEHPVVECDGIESNRDEKPLSSRREE